MARPAKKKSAPKKPAAGKSAKKPDAAKSGAKAKPAGRTVAAPSPVTPYEPKPIEGVGWQPFRYPLS